MCRGTRVARERDDCVGAPVAAMTIHRRTKPGANGIGTGCDSRGMEVIIGRTL